MMPNQCAPARRRRPAYGALLAGVTTSLWGVAVAAGGWSLLAYSTTPGASGQAVGSWPQGASFRPLDTRPTLVMFLHPHCPCSRASVEQLNRLLVREQDRVQAFVVFVRPEGVGPDWEKTPLRESVGALPG